MEITLEELLASREDRWLTQMQLLREHPGESLLCLTVVMPGALKRNRLSLVVARAAVEAIKEAFADTTTLLIERDLETGYEAYLLTTMPLLDAKRRACEIEERHPLGRLFDVDAIAPDGTPVARAAVGMPPRRCLLCGQEARYCMRSHSHTREELLIHIEGMVDEYVQRL